MYLLWRYNSDTTDYSDGTSGIFLSGIETVSTRGTSCPSVSIDTCSVSSACTWSTITDSCEISVVIDSTELKTISSRGRFLVNEETRTIRSIRESIDNGIETSSNAIDLNGLANLESNEDSSNVISSKSIPIILATLLIDYRNESVDVPNNNNLFQIFIRILNISFRQVHRFLIKMKNLLVSSISSSLHRHIDYFSRKMQCSDNAAESVIIFPDRVGTTTTINYDRCCLWENEKISTCGPAQCREIF